MFRTNTYRGIAAVAGSILALLMVATTSRAVWTDTTANTGNSFDSGTVVLTDDDGDVALFTVTNAAPGDSWIGCIDVIYQGTVGADVVMTDITTTGDQGFADVLAISVDQHISADCTDASPVTVSTAGDNLGNYTGAGGNPGYSDTFGVTAAGDHRSYEITISFDSAASNSTQGKTVGFGVTWTATSN